MTKKFIMALILLLACVLRLYQLGANPPSPTWDEVAFGYNAYSIGISGRDEFGKLLPYDYLESFGDFKPPVYAYLAVLPVKLFGLNDMSIRLPSALLGIASVWISYFFFRRLFPKSGKSELYALVATALFAVSPWHILLSRAAFEANVALFFILLGAWLFLKGVQHKALYLVFSVLPFVLSLYTFNSARAFVPLLLTLFVLSYWKNLLRIKKTVITSIILGIILIYPIVHFLLSPQARLRYEEVNIFSNIEVIKTANQEIENDDNAPWSKILHNRRFKFGIEYARHFFDNLSFKFLFTRGDGNPKFSIQSMGQMYIWELPFLIVGIIILIRKRNAKWWIPPLWILLAIAPAAVARETPHALRIENSLPMFHVLVAYGFVHSFTLLNKIKLNKIKYLAFFMFISFSLYSFFYFIENYFIHYPKQFSGEWQYGYKDTVEYIISNQEKYQNIYVSKHQGRPYIYLLYYMRYDPSKFLSEANIHRDAFGFVNITSFNKYFFDKSLIPEREYSETLFIESPFDVPDKANIQKIFYHLNGEKAFVAYTI